MTPDTIGARDFENEIVRAGQYLERKGVLTLGRYGVQAVHRPADNPTRDKRTEVTTVQSLPDIEGVVAPSGRQFIIEAKVCNQASINVNPRTKAKHTTVRQLKHLIRRSQFGASCWLLIHFGRRVLKTKSDPAETIALSASVDPDWWAALVAGNVPSISRAEALSRGVAVPWYWPNNRIKSPILDLTAFLPYEREAEAADVITPEPVSTATVRQQIKEMFDDDPPAF